MYRLGRASAIAAAVALGVLTSGCVHDGQDTVVTSNGTADLVLTETFSPVLYDYSSELGGHLTPALLAAEERKSPLPGQDSVKVYTDSEGWKGVQVRCTYHSLDALDAAETATRSDGNLFSSFSITQSGARWALDAKVNVTEITNLISVASGKSRTTEPKGITRADMTQLGMQISVSFQLPGQIVSDNATSVNGSVMTWDLLSQVYQLHAVTTTSPAAVTTTSVAQTTTSAAVTTTSPAGVTTTSAAATTTSTTATG